MCDSEPKSGVVDRGDSNRLWLVVMCVEPEGQCSQHTLENPWEKIYIKGSWDSWILIEHLCFMLNIIGSHCEVSKEPYRLLCIFKVLLAYSAGNGLEARTGAGSHRHH